MKFRKLFLILAGAVMLSSCAVTKYVSKEDVAAIDEVAVVEPFAYIEYIGNKGRAEYDDTLSWECARLITQAYNSSVLPVGKYIPVDFAADDDELYKQALASLRDINAKHAAEAVIPEVLDRLLEENGCRYGLLTFANGFTRSKGNYVKEIAVEAGLAILTAVLTGGAATAYGVPTKTNMDMWVAIADSEEDKIVFYNKLGSMGLDPVNEKNVRAAVNDVLSPLRK